MNETNVELVRNWRELGLDATLVSQLDLERGLPGGAVVVGRLDVLPTLEGVEPGLLSLFLLERSGGRVLNRAGMLAAAHDKLVTARILGRAELPHPRTAAMRAGEPSPLSPPLVLKPRLGSWGRDVFRCRDWQELERTLAVLRDRSWFQRHGTLVQELVPSLGYDLRLILAGGRVVGAGERVAVPGEWRTNISLGGSFRPAEPPEHARLLAIAAASALDADLVGVDLMPTTNGYLIVELNGAVDFDQRYSLDGQDLFLETARALGLVGERSAVPV
jgi:[lysine-biosynthesis-protein LysW]--L-2-aminoadipate ligase